MQQILDLDGEEKIVENRHEDEGKADHIHFFS